MLQVFPAILGRAFEWLRVESATIHPHRPQFSYVFITYKEAIGAKASLAAFGSACNLWCRWCIPRKAQKRAAAAWGGQLQTWRQGQIKQTKFSEVLYVCFESTSEIAYVYMYVFMFIYLQVLYIYT